MGWIKRPERKTGPRVELDRKRKERMKVYNSSIWRNLRDVYRREHPLCEICAREGRTTAAAHIHHRVSFTNAESEEQRDRLAYDPKNLMSVCEKCHQLLHHGNLKTNL